MRWSYAAQMWCIVMHRTRRCVMRWSYAKQLNCLSCDITYHTQWYHAVQEEDVSRWRCLLLPSKEVVSCCCCSSWIVLYHIASLWWYVMRWSCFVEVWCLEMNSCAVLMRCAMRWRSVVLQLYHAAGVMHVSCITISLCWCYASRWSCSVLVLCAGVV